MTDEAGKSLVIQIAQLVKWTKQLTISQYVLMAVLLAHGLIVKAFVK
jgi:hypothetical protein